MGRRRGVRHIVEVHLVRSRYERSRATEVWHQVSRRAFGELDHGDRSTIDTLRLSEVPSREASDEVLAIRVALEQQQGVVISIVPFTSTLHIDERHTLEGVRLLRSPTGESTRRKGTHLLHCDS